jgi:hypothetical protein
MRSVLFIGFLCGLVLGCSEDDDGPTNDEACKQVIEACHPKDDGSDPIINGCHETAHLEGDCLTDLQMCLEACEAAPDLTTSYGSYSSSGGTAGDGSSGTG